MALWRLFDRMTLPPPDKVSEAPTSSRVGRSVERDGTDVAEGAGIVGDDDGARVDAGAGAERGGEGPGSDVERRAVRGHDRSNGWIVGGRAAHHAAGADHRL